MKAKVFLFLSIFCFLNVMAQKNSRSNIESQINRYNQTKPGEKVYLHFDRPLYYPGDTIWYSAYLLNSRAKADYRVSEVLYVNLLDARNQVIAKSMFHNGNTLIGGQFVLNKNCPGGIYTVQAYTNWMRNWGDSSFFKRELLVQASVKPKMFLTLELDKTLYNGGDSVTAQFTARSAENIEITNAAFEAEILLNGESVVKKTITTDAKGAARVALCLPKNITVSEGLLVARMVHRGETESVSRTIPLSTKTLDLQFFPEGGDLLTQTKNTVAFKALNDQGRPADFEADILDSTGRFITHISSFHHGMGAFELTPEAGMQYLCKITKPSDFATQRVLLPKAQAQGFSLHVDTLTTSYLQVSVQLQPAQDYTLLLQNQTKLYFCQRYNAATQVQIPLTDVPAGIVKLTLLDAQNNARCERLVYVANNRLMSIELTPDKTAYQQREQTSLHIKTFVGDSTHPVSAQVSLAVVNDKVINLANDKSDNILSALLLSAEVRGKIHEPSFYFNPKEPKASKALDFLLMTQGWRRFRWQQVVHDTASFSFYPEKTDIVSGYIIEKKTQKPVRGTVYLAETVHHKRLGKVHTDAQGRFMFYNVDPSQQLILFTRKKGLFKRDVEIHYNQFVPSMENQSLGKSLTDNANIFNNANAPLPIKRQAKSNSTNPSSTNKVGMPTNQTRSNVNGVQNNNPLFLQEKSSEIQESIVVGYGVQKKSDVTGAVSVIAGEDINSRPVLGVDQSMQGKVGGLQIRNNSGTPGGSTMISVRGVGTVNDAQPLFVVDGVPTSVIKDLEPGSIKSISVIKDASACAIYGSRGVNGVILITTKEGNYHWWNKTGKLINKYVYAVLDVVRYTTTPQFYTAKYEANDSVRDDFRNTVYWNPLIQTDAQGCATVQYPNNEDETSFRITAEGLSNTLTVGRAEKTYSVHKPISVSAQVPMYAHFNDKIDLPVLLKNQTNKAISGELSVEVNDFLSINNRDSLYRLPLTVAANSVVTEQLHLQARSMAGAARIIVRFNASAAHDELVQTVQVYPIGFSVSENLSSAGADSSISFTVSAIPGSLTASFTATPTVAASINQAVAGIIHAPYGCFEQASSATYPNVLAYSFLEKRGALSDSKAESTLKYIDEGYKKLIAYEVSGGGFSWFGESPANECLTAYGIMEFNEMKKIYPVDEKMLKRSIDWLLSRRDGSGSFKQHAGKYGFSSIPKSVHNAYIVWALSEVGYRDLDKEFQSVVDEARAIQDPYRMALVILAAQNLNHPNEAAELLSMLRKQYQKHGFEKIKIETSLTHSYGKSLQNETAALFALGLIRMNKTDDELLHRSVRFILSEVKNGYFGSTQASILSLKMLCEYASLLPDSKKEDKLFTIKVNEQAAAQLAVSQSEMNLVNTTLAPSLFANGKVNVSVNSSVPSRKVPYSFNLKYNTLTPPSCSNPTLRLQVQYSKTEVTQSDFVHCTASIENITGKAQGMAIMALGIPAGLSLQAWQLKELKEKMMFDYYEIFDNYLIIYFIGMDKNEKRTVSFDLKADVPGQYNTAAHAAYLYYAPEYKTWIEGKQFIVK